MKRRQFRTLIMTLLLTAIFSISAHAETALSIDGTFSNFQTLMTQMEADPETRAYTFTYTGDPELQASVLKNIDTRLNDSTQHFYVSTYGIYNNVLTLYVKKVHFYAKNESALSSTLKNINTTSGDSVLVLTPLTLSQIKTTLKKNGYSGAYTYTVENKNTLLIFKKKIAVKNPIEKTYTLKQLNELEKYMKQGLDAYADKLTFNVPASKLSKNQAALEKLKDSYLNDNRFSNISTLSSDKKIEITLTYRLGSGSETKRQYGLADQAANAIIKDIITPNMSSFDKVKAIHDYIINHTVYDKEAAYLDIHPDTITPVGPLLNGRAICSGYASAMNLLFSKVNIESHYVSGEADNGGGSQLHAWNKVKIEDSYYNVDATWDDPVSPSGENTLSYDYYLLSDRSLAKDHTWHSTNQYPANIDYDYYLKTLPMVSSPEELATLFKKSNVVEFCSRNYSSDWFKNPVLTDDLFKISKQFKYSTLQRTINDYQVIRIEILPVN